MSVHLYPPLWIIRADFAERPGDAVPESEPDAVELSLAGGMDAPPDIPPAIADLIRRRVAADQAFGAEALAVGQIRALLKVPDETGPGTRPLRRTFGILLGASLGGARWRGWLVAQEVDYATDRDLVIESEDGPCSPEAGMVQTWNEISVALDGSEPLLGKLSPQRLEAVVCLAGRVTTADDSVQQATPAGLVPGTSRRVWPSLPERPWGMRTTRATNINGSTARLGNCFRLRPVPKRRPAFSPEVRVGWSDWLASWSGPPGPMLQQPWSCFRAPGSSA